ncbi:MAG: 50S ribosomal protein L22 [Treponema sp.]|nr:50S ribosomal protein L22 [Treponema sp.]
MAKTTTTSTIAAKKDDSGYKAKTKYLIVSPYKIRPVADLVRRKPYTEAVSLLENMPHKGARLIKKTVMSAASNALSMDKQLVEDMLYVKDIRIDEGPRMRRVWFRARGRADMLVRRMCHITVVVDQTVNAAADTKAKKSSAKKAEK